MMIPTELEAWARLELSAHTDEGGTIAGKYRVERLIGVGGMGVVVSAVHLALERPVAIKVLREELAAQASVLQRFVLEAKAAAQINSDHVCRVLDVGRLDSGLPYIVMELLHGRDLGDVLEEGQAIELSERVDWILQACEGVAQAHALGIVHRDLKPENLFLTQQRDGSPCLKVLDFGISKQLGRRTDRSITGPLGVVGSPRYMAPEQLLAADVDERADIWALGAILYELVTGVPAFPADNLPALCAKVLGEPPVPVRQLEQRAPAGLDSAVLRCLRKDREQRFRHIAELALALAPYGSEIGRGACERIRALPLPRTLRLSQQGAGRKDLDGAAPVAFPLARTERLLLRILTPERRRHVVALALTLSALGLVFLVIRRREPPRPAAAGVALAAEQPARGTDALPPPAPAAAPPSVPTIELGAVGASTAGPPPTSLSKRKHSPIPPPTDGSSQATDPLAPAAASAWTPQQAWDIRNFGSRQ